MTTVHLLVDFDSKIPNLALMKISAWAKAKGDIVYLNNESIEPDHIWLSCIFTWNRQKAYEAINFYRVRYPGAAVRYGGTGFDFELPFGDPNRINLPVDIERMAPDYMLYHDDRAVGFTQRGCDRKCPWCVVPRKEGKISMNRYSPLSEWVPEGYKKVLLLDNDIALASREVHDRTLRDAREMGLKISITQGYDIREIWKDPTKALQLAESKPWDLNFRERTLYFSWDMPQYEVMVRKGIEILKDAGFRGRELTCYVLVGFNTTHEEDVHRANILRSMGVLTYIMPYNNIAKNQDTVNLRRWANKRQLYKSMEFADYTSHFRKKQLKYLTHDHPKQHTSVQSRLEEALK
ncbi:MAG: radical SAM family protein [Thermoplasmataceae archaeon]